MYKMPTNHSQECFDMANETPDAFFTESLDMLLSGVWCGVSMLCVCR